MILRGESSVRFWRVIVWAIFIGLSIINITTYAQSGKTEKINPKAEKYFRLLSENQTGDYLYDRFYDAWLDTGTIEGLEQFLKQNLSKSSEFSVNLLLAFFYERQGKDREALKYFQEACDKEPKPDVLYQKASVESRLSDFDTAISDLLEADKTNKDKDLSIKISKLLAKLYIRSNKKDLAANVWEKLIKTNPDDEEIYEDMIELQLSEGLYDQAIDTSDQLLKKTKDNYKTIMRQLRKADIYQYSGKNEQALEIYAKTIALVGQGTWLENQICSQVERVFQKQDDIRSLQRYWQKIVEAEPQRISIKKRLAQLLLQFAETEKALTIYQDIVRVTPGDKVNQQAYIEALRSVSQTSRAVELMEQLCKQNPDDRELLIELADLYFQNRDANSVTQTMEKFLEKSDKSEYVFMRVARILENYNYKEKVFDVFDKLLSKYPDSLNAKEAYAEILYKYEKKDKALELWDSLAKAGDMQTLLRIAKTAGARGNSESSLKWLEERYSEFENDISYLNQLCEIAIRIGLYEKSRPWLQKQLKMADRTSLLQAAIKQKLQVEKNSGSIGKTTEELKTQKSLSVQETCLLSELLEYNRLSKEAQDVLDGFMRDVNNLNLQDAARNAQKEIALQQKIHLYSISKQWEQAAECTKKLIAMKGTQDSAYVLELINLYEKSSQWQLALEWIPAWKKASPGNTEPILAESRILRKLYKIDIAIERLRAADQAFENNKEILAELASLYRSYNRPAEAYRIIWRLYDEADDVSVKLGYVRDLAAISKSMGNMDSLIEKLKEQKANNRTSVVPLLALAEAYRQTEKYEERLQVLMEATRLKPNDMTLLNEIARMEESEGFWAQAIETLQQALPLDATDSTKQKLARLYIQYGNEEDGYRLLFNIDSKSKTNPREVQTTVQTLLAETNWDMAEKYLAEVLSAFPDDYRLHYLYALCLEENGKSQAALEKFIQLLEMKTEIPGNTSASFISQQSSYIDQVRKITPPGVAEILSLQQTLSQALSYNRQYDNLPYWYYPNRSRQPININIPQTVEDVPGFAIAHIIWMINNDYRLESPEIDSQFRDKILKRVLQENNYAAIQPVFDSKQFIIDNFTSSIAEIAPKYPENEVLQGFWVIYYSSTQSQDEKQVRLVFDKFKDSYPSLSCMLGLSYGSNNAAGSDLLEQSIDMIERLDNSNEYLMSRITSALRSQSSQLTQKQKSFLTEKMLSWYEEQSSQPSQNPNQSSMAYSILSTLLVSGDKEALIKVLNKEIENYNNRPSQTQGSVIVSQSEVQIQDLHYPPTYNFPDFPNSIINILYQSGREGFSLLTKLFDPNNFDDFTNQLKDPVLRAVVCIAANQDKKALEILEVQPENKSQSVSAHIIKACLLARQNKKDQAILVLANVQSLTPDVSMQQIADGAIVSYSQGINFSQNPEALDAARKAAMRLTQGQFTQSGYRERLIQAMNNLGLKDEARLFANKYTSSAAAQGISQQMLIQQQLIQQQYISQGFSQSPQYIVVSSGSGMRGRIQNLSSVQYNKIVELLREDKKEAGIRLLITELRAIAGESLLPERFYNNSNTNNLYSLVHSNKLEDKIVEMADPAPSKNIRQLLIFARLCDLIDMKDKARQTYEAILQFRPNEFGALLWLAFQYADQEPDKAVQYLLTVNRRYQNQLGRQLSSFIQNNFNNQQNLESMFKYTTLAAFYLDNLKDPDSLNLSWAANIPNTLANGYSRNNVRLPHLYSESQTNITTTGRTISGRRGVPGSVEIPVQDPQELANKRREAHNQFCKSMLRIPQLAAQGFAYLHSEARARNAVDDNMASLALEALLKYNPVRNSTFGGLINQYNWGTGKDKRLISPMEFLIYNNWKQGTLDELIAKVTPILEGKNRIGELKHFIFFASLYQAAPENFVSQAKAFIDSDIISGNPSPSPYAVLSKQSALSQIIEIRSDRSLKVSLNQFLIGMIDINNLSRISEVQEFTRNYLTQLVKEDPEAANKFLEEIVSIYLGPKDKRKEFITQNYNQRQPSGNIQNQRVQVCLDLLRNLAQNGELLFTILSQFENFEGYISDMRYYVQSGIDNAIQRAVSGSAPVPPQPGIQPDSSSLLKILNDSPFLGDVNSFRTVPVTQLQKSSVYSYMIYRLWIDQNTRYAGMRSILRQSLLNSLSQKAPGSAFGTELFIAQLSDNRRQDVYDCLVKYWDQFLKLDAARQQEISIMVCDTVGLILSSDNSLPENIKNKVEKLNKLRQDAGREKVNAFLKNKQFEDFKVSDSQFVENTSSLVSSLVSYDVDASVEILLKAVKIIDDARNRGQFQYGTNRDIISRIFSRMQEDSRNLSFGSIGFVIKLFRDTNDPALGFEPSFVNQLEYPLSERFRQYSSASNNNQVEALKKLYNDIGPYVGKGNLSGINIFRRIFDSGGWNEQVINEAINWANEQVKSGDYPDLARAFAIYAALFKQQRLMNRSPGGNVTDSSFAEAEKYFRDSLTDPNLSLQWRLMANYALAQNFSYLVSDNLVKQAIELIIKGWSLYPNLNAEYCTNMINRFISIRVPERNQQGRITRSGAGAAPNPALITEAQWTETAARFADAYIAFRQPNQAGTSGASLLPARYPQPSGYEGNAVIQLSMLEINLLLNRDDAVRAMLDGFDSRVGTYIDCWAMLVKYNKPDILKAVVEKQWNNNINQTGVIRFNNEIEKNLPGCLDKLQSDELKLCAQVLISSLQDEGNEQRPSLQRNERLRNLAGKIGEITFNSIPVKQRILEIYINDNQLMPLVSEHLALEGKNINLTALMASQDSNLIRTQSQLLVAYCVSSVLKGDPNAFIKTVQACGIYPRDNQPSGVRQVMETMGRLLTALSDTIQNNWTDSQMSSLATAMAEYLASPSAVNYDPRRLMSNLVVFLVLANRENEISAVMEKTAFEIRQNLQSYQNLYEFSNALGRFTRNRNLSMEKRIDIIKRFYQTEPVQSAMSRENQRDMLSYLTNYNILTRQEIDRNRELLKGLFIQTKQIDALLKAASLQDINITQDESQFRQYVTSLLNSTMWQDIDLCRKILIKARSLFIASGWSREKSEKIQPNELPGFATRLSGDEFISSILLQRDSSSFSFSDLGIITGLTRDANSPQIVLSQEYLQRIKSIINDRYRQILQEKNQNTLEAFKALYTQIGPYFGKGNASGVSSFLVGVLQSNRNNPNIEPIKAWANEQTNTGEYPELAREISIAAIQPSILPPSRRGGVPQQLSGEQEKMMRDYYSSVLGDTQLSVIWRLMSLEEYRSRTQFDINPDDDYVNLIFKVIPLVIEGWRQYPDLPEIYYVRIISAFARLKEKNGWKELAEQLSEAYEQFRLKSTRPPAVTTGENTLNIPYGGGYMTSPPVRRGGAIMTSPPVSRRGAIMTSPPAGRGGTVLSRGGGMMGGSFAPGGGTYTVIDGMIVPADLQGFAQPGVNFISPIELSILEIRLLINKDELIQKQINSENSTLGQSLDAWVLLAQYGKNSMLKDVIEKYWQNVSIRSSLSFTKEMEENIPKCLEGISREDMRYFAEVVLSSLADSTQQEYIPAVSHKDRMVRLAEMYSKINFSEHNLKQRILALMINEPDALKFVGDSLSEQAAKIDLNALFSNFNNTARDQFNLVLASSCEKLLTGDPNNFITTIKSVITNTSSSSQSLVNELLNTMSDNLMKTADCIKSNWSESQMAALASALTEVFAQNNISVNNQNALFIHHYIFFILGEKSDELQNAYNRFTSRSSQFRQSMQRYERLPEYYVYLAGYLVNRNLSFQQRLDIINNFHKADWIMNLRTPGSRGVPNFNIVQLLVDQQIFSRQETIENSSLLDDLINPAIKAFLNAKTIGDLGFGNIPVPPRGAYPSDINDSYRAAGMSVGVYVDSILSSINLYDMDMVLKIIIKAGELSQQELISASSGPRPGRDILSNVFYRFSQRDGNYLQGLELLVRLMRDTKEHSIFPDSSMYSICRNIVSTISQPAGSLLAAPREGRGASPQSVAAGQPMPATLDVVKNIYQQAGPLIRKGNASGISEIFSVLFSNQQWRDNQLLDSIIQWSHEQAQSGEYPSLAKEIEMIATVYRNRPMFGTRLDREKIKPVIEHYINVLSDENLPLKWRLMTIHAMENWINYPAFDELADQAMTIVTKNSNQSPLFTWDLYSNLLNHFVRSAHQRTAEFPPQDDPNNDFSPLRTGWADPASKALDSYMKYHIRQRAMSQSLSPASRGLVRQSATLPELVMLEISLLLKENEAVKQLLGDADGTLKTSSCSLALLVQYQNNELFKQFVEENIETIRLDSRGIYSPELDDRIARSLNDISRKDMQYLIKVHLYAHNNSNRPGPFPYGLREPENSSTRPERLKTLAEQFSEITFESDIVKRQALLYLTQEVSALPYISKAIHEQAKNINLSSLSSRSSPNIYILENPDYQLYLADKITMLMEGDPNGFLSMLDSPNPDLNLSSNISISLISAFLKVITGTDWNAEKLPVFLAVSDKLLSSLNNYNGFNSIYLQLMSCKAVLLLLDDDSPSISQNTMQEIQKTFDLIIPYQERFRGSLNSISIRNNEVLVAHQIIARYTNSMKMTFEKRVELLKKLYSLKQIAEAMSKPNSNSMLSLVSNARIFDMDEIINHTDTLMSLSVVTQADWQVLASFQSRQGLLDEAEKTWKKAFEMCIKSESPWNGMQGYLYFLNTNNLRDKTLEYWHSFDTKSLSEKSLTEYNNLIQALSRQN